MSRSPAPQEHQTPWLHPALNCDIVMKGGITSGIVYPGAIVELAKRYRFQSIGGASAGAIAAAATAAAELGRSTQKGGFFRLGTVPDDMGMKDGKSRLLELFRPEPSTRRLFDAAVAFVHYGKLRAVWELLWAFRRFPLLAAGLAVAAILLALFANVSWVLATAALAVAPWILVIGLLRDVFSAFTRVAENDFGLCRLGPSATGDKPALTLWLYNLLQELSGKLPNEPLTFADLWGMSLPATPDKLTEVQMEKLKELGWNARERKIDLQVMTTNLTNGRPMRLPVGRDEHKHTAEDGGGLLFDPGEWELFFPQGVMDHLRAYSSVPEGNRAAFLAAVAPGRNFRELPSGYALPVVVAARLSLSFPVLISVVPLWDIRFGDDGPIELRRVLFSDGGISSNFPIHFFDGPLPLRPTFAINLAGFEPGEEPDPNDPGRSVVEPVPATGVARETWKEIDSMFSFFVAIKDAMQNWRDNAQARLPGMRERVIHVKLARGEGGLNLGMSQKKVTELNRRGAFAGTRLVTLFSGAPARPPVLTRSWDNHRWTRLRVTLSVLDRLLRSVMRGYTELDEGDTITPRYVDRIERGNEKPYAYSPSRLTFAKSTVASYDSLVQSWDADTLDDAKRPHPIATLRIVPPV